MTRRELLERKLGKRLAWADAREKSFEREFNKSDLREEVSGIPFGQPILVGHHSEGKHRRAIERAQRAMERAHEHHEMAETHAQKAAGIERQLDNSIFSDDRDAVEQLEARIAKHEQEREQNNKINAIVRQKPKNQQTPEKIAALVELGLSEKTAEKLLTPDFSGRFGIPAYVNQNLGGRIKADRDRLERVKVEQKNRKAAEESENGVTVKKNCYGNYFVTFAEKPDRSILNELKSAGYRWLKGSWVGAPDALPESIKSLSGM